MEGGLLRDGDWRRLDGETCRVIEFRPMAGSIEGGEVKSYSKSLPYAAIDIESPSVAEPMAGFITHKLDFQHLHEAFEVRGVAEDEEVIVFWAKSRLPRGMRSRWVSPTMPGLLVWICRKGSYEIMNDPGSRPDLTGTAWFDAVAPIEKWEPEVLLR